jgi:hypothetical protein
MTGKPSPGNPAALRNAGPTLDALRPLLPAGARVFEAASGGGHHAVCFCEALDIAQWHTSDADPALVEHMTVRFAAGAPDGVVPPVRADMCDPGWADAVFAATGPVDAVFNVNMIHVAPWAACLGLLAGAARLLRDGGFVFMYGPYNVDGAYTSPGNAAFDAELKAKNPEWGLRDIEDVRYAAWTNGLAFERRIDMPSNNLSLVLRKAGVTH